MSFLEHEASRAGGSVEIIRSFQAPPVGRPGPDIPSRIHGVDYHDRWAVLPTDGK